MVYLGKSNITMKHPKVTMAILWSILILAVLLYFLFGYKKKQPVESSWHPIYRDPKKEYLAMRGMLNESNSVAGMIDNPVIGAMKHKNSLG